MVIAYVTAVILGEVQDLHFAFDVSNFVLGLTL